MEQQVANNKFIDSLQSKNELFELWKSGLKKHNCIECRNLFLQKWDSFSLRTLVLEENNLTAEELFNRLTDKKTALQQYPNLPTNRMNKTYYMEYYLYERFKELGKELEPQLFTSKYVSNNIIKLNLEHDSKC